MSEEIRISDASAAQAAARRHLEAHFGPGRIKEIRFTKTWYSPGKTRDVWEIEGIVVLKKGLFSKEERSFSMQIDPETGRVISFM